MTESRERRTTLEAQDRLQLELRALVLRLAFLVAPLLMLMTYGPGMAAPAAVIAAAILGSAGWIAFLLRRRPAAMLRYQLLLRVIDVEIAWIALTSIKLVQPEQQGDHGYLFLIVFAAATHGTKGTLWLSGVATLAVLLTRLINGTGNLPTDLGYAANYGLIFVTIGFVVVFLMRASAEAVARRERQWRAEMAERNAALHDITNQLAYTNHELEAFAYSVSHDLRAPLRSIDGFSQILERDLADKLDERGHDYLGRVHAAAQRMSCLIDDLLELSRVTRAGLKIEPVDLSGIAAEVAWELNQRDQTRSVDWVIEPGVVAMGDAHLLRIVLDNLLENAWKFTGQEPSARVEFATRLVGTRLIFLVRDNGVGFDMQYADKLFGPFQRLHGTDEFEGTGIGLATVQRVIHRHGGRVWAESRPRGGATTFYFTLTGD